MVLPSGLWITDPGLIIVKTKLTHPLQKEHDCAVIQLVNEIGLKISNRINYDHVKTTYPREEIDLTLEKHRYDIAYITPTGNTILIEVRVRKDSHGPKSSKSAGYAHSSQSSQSTQ